MSRSSSTLNVRPMPYLLRPDVARVVPNRNLGDAGAGHVGERRQEAMHLAVEPRLLDDLRAVGLERAAVVVQADAGDASDEPVRHP